MVVLRTAAAIAAVAIIATACTSSSDETTTTTLSETTSTVAALAGLPSTTTTEAPATGAPSAATSTTAGTTSSIPRPAGATTTTTTTTLTAPPGNRPPTVEITAPAHLSLHEASYDPTTGLFGAAVSLSAVADDPDGDAITIDWFSGDEGFLGSGDSIIAVLHTGEFDAAQPTITARARDQWGSAGAATIQIVVVIPSDT